MKQDEVCKEYAVN